MEHISIAQGLAKENYGDSIVGAVSGWKQQIERVIAGEIYPEDLLFGPAKAEYEKGISYTSQGLWDEAVRHFESASQKHRLPSSLIYNAWANVYSSSGDDDTALQYSSLSLEVRDDGVNRSRRALDYFLVNDCVSAISDAEVALDYPPQKKGGFHSYVHAFWVRGQCRYSDGHLEGALADYQEAIRLAKEHGYPEDDVAEMSQIYGETLVIFASR